MPENNSPRIFISYRRSDRAMAAHWVHREVAAKFGKDAVFFDVDGIPAGFDYRDFLQEKVGQCDVLLAVIGDDWLDVRDADGKRRLDNTNDFVRIEIEAALQRKIPVIPVLVENARMPTPRELPTGLHELAYRQAREVRSGHHLDDHFRRLNDSIEQAWRIHLERLVRPPDAPVQESSPPRPPTKVHKDEERIKPREIVMTNPLEFNLIEIPAGEFQMGSKKSDRENERPVHSVTISKRFWLGKYPVTNAQYAAYMKAVGSKVNNPLFWDDRKFNQPEQPVVGVNWYEAQAFCEWAGGRLPTEAEWEYACRAGSTTEYSFGDDPAQLGEYAWFSENSSSQTQPVGSKRPNVWGLHDMHGNVWEWCADWYGKYSSDPVIDPTGPENRTGRVLRGGAWGNEPRYCRSAFRLDFHPENR